MSNEEPGRSFLKRLIGLLAAVMVVSAIVTPVMADNPLDDHHEINIEMANGARLNPSAGTYYFRFLGGGLNALHITDNVSQPYGQVTNTPNTSGTFYLSDTGGRGYDDEAILMIAVNGTEQELADFSIRINSSGYNWTPTENGSWPDYDDIVYNSSALTRTFTDDDFLTDDDGIVDQVWKPYTDEDYPIYHNQDVEGDALNENTFRLIFVDLNVGILGLNCSYSGSLPYPGAARVDYTIENSPGYVVFNAYSYCNQSNQQQGVSWTNRLSTLTGSSGWIFNI